MKNFLIALLPLLLFTACTPKLPSYPEVSYNKEIQQDSKTKLLVKRFLEYWHYRTIGDMKKAWEYELPYQKYLSDFKRYKGMVGPSIGSKTELVKIEYPAADEAIITRKVHLGKDVLTKKDKWYYVKDNWYHKFYQTIFPPENEEEAQFQ